MSERFIKQGFFRAQIGFSAFLELSTSFPHDAKMRSSRATARSLIFERRGLRLSRPLGLSVVCSVGAGVR